MAPHRRLRSYLDERHLTVTATARRLGVSRQWMSQVLRGGVTPSVRLVARIERLTSDARGGPVSASEWAKAAEAR